jgi:N-acetylated-alpha-linked acidic dipeptidase
MMFKDPALECDARRAVSLDEAEKLLARFATLTRESGTPDEHTAGEYIAERLRALGVPVTVHRPDLFLSIPERSEVRLKPDATGPGVRLQPDTTEGALITSRPPSFALSTNGDEIDGELCYVPSKYAGGTGDLFDTPSVASAELTSDPVAGKIVLTEGYSMPGTVHAFERRGAVAQIFIHPGADIHEGICTPIWGAPTPDALPRKPRTPVVCVNAPDGARLAALAANGARIGIRTWLREGWAPCLLPVAEIAGTDDPDEFVLVHGHYDSWYVGIGDNAVGDAALLELARALHGLRGRLKRSVRVAWWPGHSTGRYAGSTWYADQFADDLDEWCVAHLNIDSPGCVDATAYEEVMWMAEAGALCRDAIADAVGEAATGMRPLRAGDYSFNQIGPTAFYMLLSNIPIAERRRRGYYAVGGNGGSPTWHTPNDLPPVASLSVLRRDLEVYLTTLVRVLNAPLYPFDYLAAVDEIATAVADYRDRAAGDVDLTPLVDDLDRLRHALADWRADAEHRVASADPIDRRRANATLRRLARILVPLNYARGERFDHDPAIKLPAVPRLEIATRLANAPPDRKPFLKTALVRERNKVRAMIRAAMREVAAPASSG